MLMKRKWVVLLVFLAFFFFIQHGSVMAGEIIPEPAQTGIQQQEPKPKSNIWKKLLDFLKLKRNANKKLDARILSAIAQLAKDSVISTPGSVKVMIEELKRTRVDYPDSLVATIKKIQQMQDEQLKNAQTKEELQDGNPSDVDLAALANLLIPLLDQKISGGHNSREKNELLRSLNRVRYAAAGTVYKLKVSDSSSREFTLKLKNRAEIYGFFDAAYPSGATAFLTGATSLIYYSLPVNEKSGDFDKLNGWDKSPVVEKAKQKGSKVYFSMLVANSPTTSSILYNYAAQQRCALNIVELLKKRNANGINISFKNLAKKDRKQFSSFVSLIHRTMKAADSSYNILITIPKTNFDGAYDIGELTKYADRFFIDFATNTAAAGGALAPLAGPGHQTIDASFTWYSAHGITADKLVIILPYRGVRCFTDPMQPSRNSFIGYLPFSDIQTMISGGAKYNEASETAYLDTVYHDQRNYRIWFDNESTLSKKYDYILKNGIAGLAIYFVNYDGAYNELNDELLYKFTYVDTVFTASPVILEMPKLSFFKRLKRHLVLWNFILQHPCATCFEDASNSHDENRLFRAYLGDLKIYEFVNAEKKEIDTRSGIKSLLASQNITVKDVFNHVNKEFNTFLKYGVLIFLFISMVFIVVYIFGIKYYGGEWKYKKMMAGILCGIIAVFLLLLSTYCFTSDLIPLFGVSNPSFNGDGCAVDPTCVNVPYNTLLLLIFISVLVGFAVFRYLIIPLISKDDVP